MVGGFAALICGCGTVDRDAPMARISGDVHGLWNGVDGVVLRLEAHGIDARLTVSNNGPFQFDPGIARGGSYTVTIASNPANHSCMIESGGNGSAAVMGNMPVSVSCHGPDVELTLSGPRAWRLDSEQDIQMISVSAVTQAVALTIQGSSLTSAMIDGAAIALGQPTAPIALVLGATNISVSLAARGGQSKTYQVVVRRGAALLEQIAYGKASNTQGNNGFGGALALDGDTLVVGAPCESSGATGVDRDPAGASAPCAGAVYVFARAGGTWSQQAYIKASNTEMNDEFGAALALSGNTLAVGAPGEDSSATGIDGAQADNLAGDAGAVYVFVRTGTTWSQQAYIKASNAGAQDHFGNAVTLSADTLAVGAHGEASAATQIDGDQADDTATKAGAVYVFVRNGVTWGQQAYLKASNGQRFDELGFSVALAGDTLIASAPGESSAAGAVYVFVRTAAQWAQQAHIEASNPGEGAFFGCSVALSHERIAVGAYQESSAAQNAGAAYVFTWAGTTWQQEAYIRASNAEVGDLFGWSIALSGDTLVAGAYHEASAAIGVDGAESNNSVTGGGAAYLFVRSGTDWEQRAYVKASNTGMGDLFGWSVAVSDDTLVVAAQGEASASTSVNPANGQQDNSASNAGAIYLFR